MRGAKHFSNAPAGMPLTHHHTGIRQWREMKAFLHQILG